MMQRLTALIGVGLLFVLPVTAQTWDALRATIRKKFPEVRQLSTQALADWLADTNRAAPLLLDARSAREFAVSHLRGSRRYQSVRQVQALRRTNTAPIVVYCSVGYRSSAVAAKLQKAGLRAVYNLEGSIFAWANEDRPVYRGEQRLEPAIVHPYSAKWGKLLDRKYHPR